MMQEVQTNKKPFLTIILPCYNEEAILQSSFDKINQYVSELSYDFEILIINDGSSDKTGKIADEIVQGNKQVRVIHHPTNLNLGNALQTGFCNSKGDILVVMDIDLSYSVEHIGRMVDKIVESSCDMVVASPYMKGGKVTAVPFARKMMSKWLNKFMNVAAQDKYFTFTGMVRAYRASFIKNVNLKTKDYEINPEIMYKAMILRAQIIEIPAHLDWTEQNKVTNERTSSIRIIKGFFSGTMAAFIFRPYIFFIGIGSVLMLLSMYQLVWLLFDTLRDLKICFSSGDSTSCSFSISLAKQFLLHPQSFLVGGITFLAAIQFLSLGFLSLQSKRYFEELFHLGTSLKKKLN